jgi:hypothetical protein
MTYAPENGTSGDRTVWIRSILVPTAFTLSLLDRQGRMLQQHLTRVDSGGFYLQLPPGEEMTIREVRLTWASPADQPYCSHCGRG